MDKKSNNSFSTVLSLDPSTNKGVKGISSFLTKDNNTLYSKHQYVISYLQTTSFIHAQISISKNIPEEDIYDAIYNKAYDELALDQAVEYKIQIIETFFNVDDENRSFHVFIADPNEIEEIFKESIQKVKYIDQIVPSPLLFKTLYSKNIIETSGIDCFVYIQENDAFLTIYNDKEFLYVKHLNFSFNEMYERFCEISGERIEYEEFKYYLESVNLKNDDSGNLPHTIALYKELISTIHDVITYVKRAYDLNNIDKIYFGCSLNIVSKLDEIIEAEIGIPTLNLDFDLGFETENDIFIEELHKLLQLWVTVNDEEKYDVNFSLFHRPPKFIKRESGKLIFVTAASFVLAFIYPVVYWILGISQNIYLDNLNSKYKELHIKRITLEASLKNKRSELKKYLTLLKDEKDELESKKYTLYKINSIKNSYLLKAKELTNFSQDIGRYKVKVDNVAYFEDNKTGSDFFKHRTFVFNLVSSKSIRLTNLLKHLTKKYENKYSFSIDEIKFDEDKKLYFTELKAETL